MRIQKGYFLSVVCIKNYNDYEQTINFKPNLASLFKTFHARKPFSVQQLFLRKSTQTIQHFRFFAPDAKSVQ